MFKTVVPRLLHLSSTLLSTAVLTFAGVISGVNSTLAQQSIPVCPSPTSGEYVLLIISPSSNNQRQLRQTLPPQLKTSTCRYLKDTVTRISGFSKMEDANRWARYVNSVAGLTTIITTKPSDVISTETTNYKPQRLGEGFAVLVDYFNRPEMATEVRQVVGGDVGFVSYGQRPYLMAVYTTNQKEAYNTLQSLSERGYFAVLVDSRKVMLLRSVVKLQ